MINCPVCATVNTDNATQCAVCWTPMTPAPVAVVVPAQISLPPTNVTNSFPESRFVTRPVEFVRLDHVMPDEPVVLTSNMASHFCHAMPDDEPVSKEVTQWYHADCFVPKAAGWYHLDLKGTGQTDRNWWWAGANWYASPSCADTNQGLLPTARVHAFRGLVHKS